MIKSNKILPNPADKNYSRIILLKIIPGWITPNMISILRLMMIPIIIALMALGNFGIALICFLLAAALDAIDGALARARHQISELGLILDPLADKLLIIAIIGFLLLVYPFKLLIIYVFIFDLLIMIVSAIRISRTKTIEAAPIQASNVWGKSKMLSQVVGISLAFAWLIWPLTPLLYMSALIIWLSLVFQVKSAIAYA